MYSKMTANPPSPPSANAAMEQVPVPMPPPSSPRLVATSRRQRQRRQSRSGVTAAGAVKQQQRQLRELSKALAGLESRLFAAVEAVERANCQQNGAAGSRKVSKAKMQKPNNAALAVPPTKSALAVAATTIMSRSGSEWKPLKASKHAQNTVNPIRRVTDCLSVPPNPEKAPIRLNLGDPTLTGCLPPSEVAVEALKEALDRHKADGYGPAIGTQEAREAVAQHFSTPDAPISADDVVLASGCSHALEMAIVAIAEPGQNILVPQPGFPLYTTLCRPNQIETRQYRLQMDKLDGLIDLEHLESQIDDQTRAIIVNNPSNPTGVVFPKWHLEQILQLAQKHKVPIIADEIYGDLVYAENAKFHPLATLSPRVPIITCDGIGKRYLVPGWRLGWLIVHDRFRVLSAVKQGIVALSQKIVGPNSLVQAALPRILHETPQSFFDNTKKLLAANADIVYNVLSKVPGLKPLRPQGAMYCMVGFDPRLYGDESQFVQQLIAEESVYCLPGSAFSLPNWFRLVLAFPAATTLEACERIAAYCQRHLQPCTDRLALWESLRLAGECRRREQLFLDGGSEGSSVDGTETDEEEEEGEGDSSLSE